MWYDKNGNITALQRYGEIDDVVDKIEIDNLTYKYDPINKNQLVMVDDSSNITHGFKDDDTHPDPLVIDSTIDYTYDDYGNMLTDTNKGITTPITYNHLNLPIRINLPNGIIDYLYNAAGVKLEKKVTIGSTVYTTDYQSGYQYIDSQLQFFPHAEGYVNVVNGDRFNYVYNYLDHLGNIRVSYGLEPGTNALKILEENHYYPFGLKHKNYGVDLRTYKENGLGEIRLPLVSEVSYKYKYNGKEWQDELGLNFYDYGARNYDAALGRWMNMDPLAENSIRWTPYNYAYNNPMVFVDPDGMQAQEYDMGYGRMTTYSNSSASFTSESYLGLGSDNDDVILKGGEKQAAFTELQKSVQGELTLSMDANGNVSYTQSVYGPLSPDATQLIDAINDNSIKVNVTAENTKETSTGNLYVIGAFMGNTVTPSPIGNTVSTSQEINPASAAAADNYSGTPGSMTLHEVTESYQGGLISQKTGVSAGFATQTDVNNPSSVYYRSHRLATPQKYQIFRNAYDAHGNVLQSPFTNVVRLVFYVQQGARAPQTILIFP